MPVFRGGLAGVVAGAGAAGAGACGGGRAPGCWGVAGGVTSGCPGAPASGGGDAARSGDLDAPASGGTCLVADGDGTYRGRDAVVVDGAGGSRGGDAGPGVRADDPPEGVDALDGRGWASVREVVAGAGACRGGAPFTASAGAGRKLTMTIRS